MRSMRSAQRSPRVSRKPEKIGTTAVVTRQTLCGGVDGRATRASEVAVRGRQRERARDRASDRHRPQRRAAISPADRDAAPSYSASPPGTSNTLIGGAFIHPCFSNHVCGRLVDSREKPSGTGNTSGESSSSFQPPKFTPLEYGS